MPDPVLEQPSGVIDGVNDLFETSVAYVAGTLYLAIDGQLISRDDSMAPIETGGKTFRIPSPPVLNTVLHVWYHTSAPTPGAFYLPSPDPESAIDLSPAFESATDMFPIPASSEIQDGASFTPDPEAAVNLLPEPGEAVDLKPTPVDSEEM